MLGSAQEAWLADTLRRSPARWKLIGQGTMFAQLKALGRSNADGGSLFVNPDQWDGYPPCRDRVFDMIDAAGGNVLVLTGDIHSAWANDLARDPNNPDVAAGGYDPATGAGSRAVEFVATSITSPGLPDPDGLFAGIIFGQNPHIKHADLDRRGYLLLDIQPQRVVGEFWVIDTVAAPSAVQTFVTAFEVQHGRNRLVPSAMTPPKPNPPAPAP
jgi:alkaline phosphatase D